MTCACSNWPEDLVPCWVWDCLNPATHGEWRYNAVTKGITRGHFCNDHRIIDACAPLSEPVPLPSWVWLKPIRC